MNENKQFGENQCEKERLFENLQNENNKIFLITGKNICINDMSQTMLNLHWNRVLASEKADIICKKMDTISSYRKCSLESCQDLSYRQAIGTMNKKKPVILDINEYFNLDKYPINTQSDIKSCTNKCLDAIKNSLENLGVKSVIIIESIEEDEFEFYYDYFHNLGTHSVHIFNSLSVSNKIEKEEDINAYPAFVTHNETACNYFSDLFEKESEYEEPFIIDEEFFYINRERKSIPKRELNQTASICKLLSSDEVRSYIFPKYMIEPYFNSFIVDSKTEPQWYAYENKFNIIRNKDNDIYKKVLYALKNPGRNNEKIICVSGQSSCGKSVSIYSVAYKIYNEKEYPVLLLNNETDFSDTENIKYLNELINSFKQQGAESVLIIWDSSADLSDISKYYLLARNFDNREINYVLLVSSYADYSENNIHFISMNVELDKQEKEELKQLLKYKAKFTDDAINSIVNLPDNNLLEIIYQLFMPSREKISLGLSTEARKTVYGIIDTIKNICKNTNNVSELIYETSLQAAFRAAGLNNDNLGFTKKDIQKKAEEFIYRIAFCSRFNLGVPFALVCRCIGIFDTNEIQLLMKLPIIDFKQDDNNDFKCYIRSLFEAKLLIKIYEKTKKQVELFGELLKEVNNNSSEETLLIRDILIKIGPNSKDVLLKEEFKNDYGVIIDYLEEFRDDKDKVDSRIILQELTFRREYYLNQYLNGSINKEIFIKKTNTSIKIGEEELNHIQIQNDESLKRKMICEICQQKLLQERDSNGKYELINPKYSNEFAIIDIMNTMKNIRDKEPSNPYYYVCWFKAAEYIINPDKNKYSNHKRYDIVGDVLFVISNVDDEQNLVAKNTEYLKFVDILLELIYQQDDDKYLEEKVNKGNASACYVLAKKQLHKFELDLKLKSSSDVTSDYNRDLTEDDITKLGEICTKLQLFETKECKKLYIKIIKSIYNGRAWQNYSNKDNMGRTFISRDNWQKLYEISKNYYDMFIKNSCDYSDSINEIYLYAISSVQTKIYDKNEKHPFDEAIELLNKIKGITEYQYIVRERRNTKQFICDEKGNLVVFTGQVAKQENKKLYIKFSQATKMVYSHIVDISLQNEIAKLNSFYYDFAIGLGYMGMKAHRFKNQNQTKYEEVNNYGI